MSKYLKVINKVTNYLMKYILPSYLEKYVTITIWETRCEFRILRLLEVLCWDIAIFS